jgi:Gpi18-like mannosyltransferase
MAADFKDVLSGLAQSRYRFLYVLIFIACARAACAVSLFQSLSLNGFRVPLANVLKVSPALNFVYLFSGWDTGYYVHIAEAWYPASIDPRWAFFPMYPSMIRALSLVGVTPILSAWIISTVFGFLSVIAFQKVAEHYLPVGQAAVSSMLYFLLPPVFLFTGVSYTEPEFLLFSLLTWHFHLKGREMRAGVMAVLASLTRTYGILLVIPLAYDYFRSGRIRRLAYLAIPAFPLLGWLVYTFALSGDPFASFTARSRYWADPTAVAIEKSAIELVQGHVWAISALMKYLPIILAGFAFVGFMLFLSYKAWRIENALGLYCFFSIFAICYFAFIPGPFSIPRYVSFLFPVGLPLYSGRGWLLVIVATLLLLLDYGFWAAFFQYAL